MSREAAPLCTAKHAGCGGTPTIHTPALHCNRTCAASLQPSSTAFLLPVCLPVYLPPHCLHAWRPPPAETLWHPSTGCKMPHQGPCEASDILQGEAEANETPETEGYRKPAVAWKKAVWVYRPFEGQPKLSVASLWWALA